MILYLSDWDKYPNAIIDTKTPNKDFLELAAKYRDMGIKNHGMILSLLNPALQGVDPFSPDLTSEQKAMIMEECKKNFWYFLRECVVIPSRSGNVKIRFKPNRANIASYWLFWNNIQTLEQIIRQTGKTMGKSVLMVYLLGIKCINTNIGYLTLEAKVQKETMLTIKTMFELLPPYLNARKPKEIGNSEFLSVELLGNKLYAKLPNKSERLAEDVGRGFPFCIIWIDEFAVIYNLEQTLPVLLSTGNAARALAEKMNEPWGTMFTTTAGDPESKDGKYAYEIREKATRWNDTFLDIDSKQRLVDMIKKTKKSLRVLVEFNHRQLGYTDEWLKSVIDENNLSGPMADRDAFNIWRSSSSSQSPFDNGIVNKLNNSIMHDYYAQICDSNNYIIRWYGLNADQVHRALSERYTVLTLDTSDAVLGDDIFLTFKDVSTGETLGASDINDTNLTVFIMFIGDLLVRYEKITLIIERKSSAPGLIDQLILYLLSKNINPFRRIWNTIVDDYDIQKEKFTQINKPLQSINPDVFHKAQFRSSFGFNTSGFGNTARSNLFGTVLRNAIKYTGDTVRDSKIVSQLLSLRYKNGRLDHPSGGHDDGVVSWVLGYWFLSHAKNLSYYGIPSGYALSRNSNIRSENTYYQSPAYVEQEKIKIRLKSLYEDYIKNKDALYRLKIEREMKGLFVNLKQDTNTYISFDQFMEAIKNNKKLNRIKENTT